MQDKGGTEGIWVNDEGNVAETCMGNVAIVDQAGALRSPPYDGSILAGTTMLRAFALARKLIEVSKKLIRSLTDGAIRAIQISACVTSRCASSSVAQGSLITFFYQF